MKRTAIVILALFASGAWGVPARAADRNDFKVIQNAVRPAPGAAARQVRRPVRWLKVEISDSRSHGADLKIALPIALIELVLESPDSRHFRVRDDHCEIDLKAVWKALKKAGPLALVEIEGDDGGVFKIWLE